MEKRGGQKRVTAITRPIPALDHNRGLDPAPGNDLARPRGMTFAVTRPSLESMGKSNESTPARIKRSLINPY